MKKGCLLLIAVWIGVAIGYYELFKETQFQTMVWIPILLGLGAAMIAGNIHGIILALQQKRAAGLQPSQWKDGQYVVASGTISPIRGAIVSPFSGTPACIVEYELKRGDTPGADYLGFLMTPSALMTRQGSVRLVGFPMLVEMLPAVYQDDDSYKRAGEYFAKCTFQEKSSNPISLISQLNKVLADDDGEVKMDFVDKKATLHTSDGGLNPAQTITTKLSVSDYRLQEIVIRSGQEVTAFGTYRQAKQAIDIGSGIKNISHSLKLGNATQSTNVLLRRSLITTIIVGAIFVGANLLLLPQIGIDPHRIISHFLQRDLPISQ